MIRFVVGIEAHGKQARRLGLRLSATVTPGALFALVTLAHAMIGTAH